MILVALMVLADYWPDRIAELCEEFCGDEWDATEWVSATREFTMCGELVDEDFRSPMVRWALAQL